MPYLNQLFYENGKSIFGPYGFKRYGRTFVRVIHDVVQCFDLEKIFSGRCCRVSFTVLPLCLVTEKADVSGQNCGCYLRRFEPPAPADSWNGVDCANGWATDPHDEAVMDACMSEISRFLQTYLLPYFLKADNCEAFLEAFFPMMELFDRNSRSFYPNSRPWSRSLDSHIYTPSLYYAALKCGNMDLAYESRRRLFFLHANAFFARLHDQSFYGEEAAAWDRLLQLYDELAKIGSRDHAFLLARQDEIAQNEAIAREFLKKYIVK